MNSRLPAMLHPIAGRPLVWHTVALLAGFESPPERLVILTDLDLSSELIPDLPVPIEVVVLAAEDRPEFDPGPAENGSGVLVIDATGSVPDRSLTTLLASAPGTWLPDGAGHAVAVWMDPSNLLPLLALREPLRAPNGILAADHQLRGRHRARVVRDRKTLALATRRVRDRMVRSLMSSGVTFLLPETVLVDVDVRIGRDSIVYPGVVLEGQTTIGEETVVGPGCRIVDSWVGSGVELKGWNYISHTSIRNRAILEPYVRRGFD